MSSPPQSSWATLRRGLILLMVLIVGTSLYSLLLGRPGDFGAGLVGLVFGGAAALVVVLVEVISRWSARRRARLPDQDSRRFVDPCPENLTPSGLR